MTQPTPFATRTMAHIDGEAVISRCKRDNMGFLTEDDVAAIAADPRTRLSLLLVRCGRGRFLAPADQVQHFIDIIEQHASRPDVQGDYIRDVSIPVGDLSRTFCRELYEDVHCGRATLKSNADLVRLKKIIDGGTL